MNSLITRKEIAAALGVSVRTVARRQAQWGLNDCQSASLKRPVAFFRSQASAALIRAGVAREPLPGTAVPV